MSLEWEQPSWKRGDEAGRNFLKVMPLFCKHLLSVYIFRQASAVLLNKTAIIEYNKASI